MLRLYRSLLPRKETTKKFCDIGDFSWLGSLTSRLGISTARAHPGQDGNILDRIFADYSIFKGKAALKVNPVLPKFCKLDSGGTKVDKNGVVLLTFMPAIGLRKYNWEKRQCFALSPTEVGCLISLGSAESCEFFHDPSMKSSGEGQVKKTLAISPIGSPNDGGYFFNLSVMNSLMKTNDRLSVPVTKAEFAVMRTAFSFVLPHLMGWDKVVRPQQSDSRPISASKNIEARIDHNFEWEK